MAPPQQSSTSFRQSAAYAAEPKRMRLSTSSRSTPATTTRASTGAPASMTNKGSVYKAQRGRAVTAAAVKAKSPTAHRRRGRKGKSVYRGVCVTREGKWRAVIYKERKQLYLGVYESEVDAAKAHDRAARFHFAENAVCNFESEQEADRQAALHQQRQLVEQQQLVEGHPHAHLHGGSFSVGREEFDDLEEYHRGLEEACSSEDDQCCAEGDSEESGDAYGEDCTRSSRSMSSSSASGVSMLDDLNQIATTKSYLGREVAATIAAVAAHTPISATASIIVPRPAPSGVVMGGGEVHVPRRDVPQRARCSSGMSSCESDSDFAGVTTSALLEPPAPEGMGFPYAEDLLGYEMQSWFCCEDEDDQSMLKNQQPFSGGNLTPHYQPASMTAGASHGWGFDGLAPTSSNGWSRSSSGSMSSSLSCDDDYIPSALPPLMGISAEP